MTKRVEYIYGVAQETNYTYDDYDNKLSELLPGNSSPTRYEYNDTNNPPNPRLMTKQTDPLGHSTSYTYDAQGRVLTTTDAKGNISTNTYDSKGNLSSSQAAQDQPYAHYYYDSNGNLTSETDPAGIVTNYSYDASGNMLSQTVAALGLEAATTTYSYDANGNRLSETKTSSIDTLTTIFSYDAMGRLVETVYPDGTNTQTTYDSLGHVVGSQDQKGRSTSNFYDAQGRATTIEHPDNRMSVYGYDKEGHRTNDDEYGTDGSIHSTTTKYDDLGRPVTVTHPDGGRTITTYYSQGWVEDSIDENGNDTHSVYDSAGRKTSQTAGYTGIQTQETDFGYDANGNQTTLTVAGQLQSTTQYDSMNRAATIVYPQPGGSAIVGSFITQYDADGRKTGQVDQAGKVTNYTVDGLGRTTKVTQVTSIGNLTTAYTFDQVGNQLTQVDANTHQTIFTPDNMGRRKTRQLPDGRTEHYTNYDATGNLTNKTDFAGNSFTYGYTTLDDRLISVSGPGVALSTGYDGFLRRYSMTDLSGQTTFNYNSRDRMVKQTSPTGWGTLTYSYLYGGQVNTVSSSNENGNSLTYDYDSLNRPNAVVDGVKTTTINYDGVGNISQIVLPNGVAVTYVVDALNRVTGVTIVSGSSVLGGYSYTLGPTGNRLSVTEVSGRAVTWTPDDLYRLTDESIVGDPSGNTGDVAYTYDNVGNRNTRSTSITGLAPQNFTGGYTTADLLKPTFNFDDNGNQLSDAQGRTYTYNSLNQLTRVQGTGLDVSYVYDGDGLRVQKTNNLTGVTTNYLWDRNNLTGYPQVSEELQNGSVVRRYVYGPKGPLYMVQLVGSSWVTSYFGLDATGSVRFLMNDSGQITDQYTRDAFGNLLSSSGAGTANSMGLDGEYTEPETGLVYLRARWYDPNMGRFLTMDIFEGSHMNPKTLNKYIAYNDDPSNIFDPTGRAGIDTSVKCKTTNLLLRKAMPNTFGDGSITLEPFDEDKGKIQRALMAENLDYNSRYPYGMKAVGRLINNQLYGGKMDRSSYSEVLSFGKFQGYPYGNNGDSDSPNADKPFWDDLKIANNNRDSRQKHYADYIQTAASVADQVIGNSLPEPFPNSTVYFMWAEGYEPNRQAANKQLYEIGREAGNIFYGYVEDKP